MNQEDLEKRVKFLEKRLKSLENNTTLPKEIGDAVKARVLLGVALIESSDKVATSEDQSVNESGSSTYAVLSSPTGFMQVQDQGTTKYIPYY